MSAATAHLITVLGLLSAGFLRPGTGKIDGSTGLLALLLLPLVLGPLFVQFLFRDGECLPSEILEALKLGVWFVLRAVSFGYLPSFAFFP